MKFEEIRELIQLMREHQIAEITMEEEGKKIRVVAAQQTAPVLPAVLPAPVVYAPQALLTESASASTAPSPSVSTPAVEVVEEGMVVTSPIVGTYYASPTPDSPPFVGEGDEVEEDTVLCIVEAMKVMNEIRAEIKGRILKILADNGHPVEFGQPLFRVLPAN